MRGLLKSKLGCFNVIDDITGEKVRSDKTRFDWRGFRMSKENWSEKHPQLTLRPRDEKINVDEARERPADKFVTHVDPNSLYPR